MIAAIVAVQLAAWAIMLAVFLILFAILRAWFNWGGRRYLRAYLADMRKEGRGITDSRWEFRIYMIVAVAIVWGGEIVKRTGRTAAGESISFAGILCLMWCIAIVPWRRYSRLWRDVKAAEFRICLECYYALRGLGNVGLCPECGEPFEYTRLRRKWLEVMEENE